ncbi:hypothetical protein FVER14953_20403 [Fusarium verticillioides]|nr:hypothetical protein FVER14953_20403 [Fusarium verticillioides]
MAAGVQLMTFEVVRPLSPGEAQRITRESQGEVKGLYPVREGLVGYIPDIEVNFETPGSPPSKVLKPFIWVQLLHYTAHGLTSVPDTIEASGKCMVPKSHIRLGAMYAPNKKVVSELVLGHPTIRISGTHSSTPFRQWLESLYGSLASKENIDAMAELGIPERLTDMIANESKRATLVKEFLDGMTYCKTLDAFEKGLPTFEEIWSAKKIDYVRQDRQKNPPRFAKSTGSFFYLILYFVKTKEGTEYAVYCGQSVDPPKRFGQHMVSLTSGNSNVVVHHKIGRKILKKGGSVRMYPITFIQRGSKDHSVLWSWAELALIVLFECFNPYMLSIETYNRMPDSNDALDMGLANEREAFHKTWSAPLAKRILDVGQRVKNSRPALKKFSVKEPFIGCNWAVPILERSFVDANLWVRTTTLGEKRQAYMYQFRTHPKRVQKDRQIIVFIGKRNKEAATVPRAFKLPLTQDLFPSARPGSIVNVVIEIMANPDTKHPYPYVEIPSIGPFDIWTEAMRLGIRIEFLDDNGSWRARYLRSAQYIPFTTGITALKKVDYGDSAPSINCFEVNWVHCMKVLATLLQWKWKPQGNMLAKRVFIPYNGRVRHYDFQFVKQQIILSDPEPINVPLPKLRTLDETADLIETTFGHDVHIAYFPGPELLWTEQSKTSRYKCDLCHIGFMNLNGTGTFQIAKKCEQQVIDTKEGRNLVQCKFSAALGRYCTFTAGIEHKQDQYYKLTYHGRLPFRQHTIPEPANAIQFLEQIEDDDSAPPEDVSVPVEAD